MVFRSINGVRYYEGDIIPGENVVMVFGSNPEGRHGAGAARVARERFGAVYGQGEGLQGNSYALPTKDLRVKENRGLRSISPEAITENIKRLYDTARQNPDKTFCIAYRNTDRASLNGYTGIEMMRMFAAAGPLPENVLVSEEWHDAGREILTYEDDKEQRLERMFDSNVLSFNATVIDGNIVRLPEEEYMGFALRKTVEDALAEGIDKDVVQGFAVRKLDIIETRYDLSDEQRKQVETVMAPIGNEALSKESQKAGDVHEYDYKFLIDSLTQEDGYLYRGFYGEPDIRPDGSVLFVAHRDPLYSQNGISDRPVVSFSPDMNVAAEYALGQYEGFLNESRLLLSDREREEYADEVVKSGYSLVKVRKEAVSNSFFTNGKHEVMFEEDVLVPKGFYEFRNVWQDVEFGWHCEDSLIDKEEYNIDLENESREKTRLVEEEKLAGMIREYISSGDSRDEAEFRDRLYKEFSYTDWKIDKVMQDVNRRISEEGQEESLSIGHAIEQLMILKAVGAKLIFDIEDRYDISYTLNGHIYDTLTVENIVESEDGDHSLYVVIKGGGRQVNVSSDKIPEIARTIVSPDQMEKLFQGASMYVDMRTKVYTLDELLNFHAGSMSTYVGDDLATHNHPFEEVMGDALSNSIEEALEKGFHPAVIRLWAERAMKENDMTPKQRAVAEEAVKSIVMDDDIVLGSDGKPLVLWHGSPAEFEEFDFSHAGDNTGLVEYTNRETGEKILSDSDKAIFFTDNRELAISYGFLARTQELLHLTGLMNDLISCLRDPLQLIFMDYIKSKKDLIEGVRILRGENDPEINAFLDRLPDLNGEKPISSMDKNTREELRNDLIQIRTRYKEYWDMNRNGGVSNQLNNIVRQRDYLTYFVENFDRVCEGDSTVLTEFGEDFNHYSQQFFSKDGNVGVDFFQDGNGEMMVSGFEEKPVSLKSLSLETRKEILQRIEDDLNGCIAKYNANIDESGYRKHTHLYPVLLKAQNPLEHDYQESAFPDKYKPNEKYGTAYVAARQVKKALADGNEAVVYRNIRDPFLGNTYGVFSKDSIVMLDRSILPEEQFDSTLGKVSGTVHRYEELNSLKIKDMVKDLNDYAYDLAFEILFGGDRFDQNDFAYGVSTVLKEDGVEAFRDMVRGHIGRITAEKRMELPSVKFVEGQLRCWVPDDIVEEGKLLQKLCDRMESNLQVHCIGSHLFAAYDFETYGDGLYEKIVNGEGKEVYDGIFPAVYAFDRTGRVLSGYSVDKENGMLYGIGEGQSNALQFVSVDMNTKECRTWDLSRELALKCQSSFMKEGLEFEVLSSTASELLEDPALSADDALLRGCREWDVVPDLSKGQSL